MRWDRMVAASVLVLMSGCRGPSSGTGSAPTSVSAAASPNTTASVATTPAGPAAASADVGALRDDARLVLERYCGQCHIRDYPTALPGALAIFDLREPDWSARMSEAQLHSALWRLGEPLPPEGAPNEVSLEERARLQRYVDGSWRAARGWMVDAAADDDEPRGAMLAAPTMPLRTESYQSQIARWPQAGRHILAQYDATTVIVYQAYAPEIGRFAAEHGFFGGPFSYERMSWVKPNFLWMMYRSGWGTKQGQEVTLAVRIRREAFDAILAEAVHSAYVSEVYESEADWKARAARSQVRLQWDPDHGPSGAKFERRAIQLGLRGDFLRRYGREWIVAVEDISTFVEGQRVHARASALDELVTPAEEVYPVADAAVAARLGVAPWP